MYTRQYKTRKKPTQSSDIPQSNQFTPRSFVVQPQPHTPGLQAQKEKERQSNSSLANITSFPSGDRSSPPPIQMKLTIGQPGDRYEQEADQVAADVVQRMNAPESHQVQRQELQRKPMVQYQSNTEIIQRLRLPEKGQDIDETDNMILKEEYFLAKKENRLNDLELIRQAQQSTPRNEDSTIMIAGTARQFAESQIESLEEGEQETVQKLAQLNIAKYLQQEFLIECQVSQVTPSLIIEQITQHATSQQSTKKALIAFAEKKIPLGSAIRLASQYDRLMALRMNTIQVDEVVSLLREGFLYAKKDTYCDTPLKSGSVYIFHLAMTDERLLPEWHVHWGPQNHVEAASFKNTRKATGEGARVSTDASQNNKMRSALTAMWGP